MTHLVLIGLGILIAVLTVVSALGILPSLRIVPDDTQRWKDAECADHGQRDDQHAEGDENDVSHGRRKLPRSARFAAASTAPTTPRSGGSG